MILRKGPRSESLFSIIKAGQYSGYRNFPKFSDRQVWANSADPDQTADQGLHCLQFRRITLRKRRLVQLLG